MLLINDAQFKDEVFQLNGKHIFGMWHMLCERGKDLNIEYDQVEVSFNTGSANWIARYTFSSTKFLACGICYANEGKI